MVSSGSAVLGRLIRDKPRWVHRQPCRTFAVLSAHRQGGTTNDHYHFGVPPRNRSSHHPRTEHRSSVSHFNCPSGDVRDESGTVISDYLPHGCEFLLWDGH